MGLFNPASTVKRWTLNAIGENKNLASENLSNLSPYSDQGGAAWGRLGDLMGLNGKDAGDKALASFQTSPGYQFQMQEGTNAIERSAAARGGLNSGATMKALNAYGQNVADQEYGNYLQRLSGLAGTGYNATNAENAIRTNLGNVISQGYGQIGQANANQSIGQLSMLTSLLGNGLFGGGQGNAGGFSNMVKNIKSLGGLFGA